MPRARYLDNFQNELVAKFGPNWDRKRKRFDTLRTDMTMEKLEKVKDLVRQLVPIDTALMAEGFTTDVQVKLFSKKDKEPYKYIFDELERARAEGEAAIIKKMADPQTTQKEQLHYKWMLERALETDHYSPRTKSTKIVKEEKSVNVTMRLNSKALKAVPALGPAIDAQIIEEGTKGS